MMILLAECSGCRFVATDSGVACKKIPGIVRRLKNTLRKRGWKIRHGNGFWCPECVKVGAQKMIDERMKLK